MAVPAPTAASPPSGIVPRLDELLALRGVLAGRRRPGRGSGARQAHAVSVLRGRGMEYAESREYAVGDDARHIDWRLTARTGRAHTKLFQAERDRLTLLLADTAPALYFGTRVRFKSVQAARAGALAAWLALADGDRVGALRAAGEDALVAPAAGLRGVLGVLQALVRWYAAAPARDPGLLPLLEHAQRLLRPGARWVLLADPASVLAVPPARWSALAAHHEAIALLLVDPLEQAPPAAPLAFRPAQGARVELALDAAGVRQRWQAQFADVAEAARARLQAARVRVQLLASDAPSEAWLGLLDRAGRPR